MGGGPQRWGSQNGGGLQFLKGETLNLKGWGGGSLKGGVPKGSWNPKAGISDPKMGGDTLNPKGRGPKFPRKTPNGGGGVSDPKVGGLGFQKGGGVVSDPKRGVPKRDGGSHTPTWGSHKIGGLGTPKWGLQMGGDPTARGSRDPPPSQQVPVPFGDPFAHGASL